MASSTGEENLSDGSLIFKSWPSPVHSNSPRRNLTPSEIEAVQSFMSDAEAEVTRCTDEVARLQAMTAKVKEYQTELAHKISVHQSFICLINRLPSELLSLIFSFFCTVDFWDWGPFEAKMKSPMRGSFFREPFVIATVCRRWRNIALSTPSLWSTFMLAGDDLEDKDRSEEKIHYSREDYRPEEDDSEEPCIFPDEVLEVALERSAQHSLTLWTMHLDMDQFYWPSAFTRMLRQVSPRFKEMHLAGGSDPFRHKDSPNVVFDQLSVVQVFPYHNGNWIGMDPLPWLSTAPNVRTLMLESSDSEEDFWTHVPVQSIQYLFFERYHITTGISKLARFPNIVSSGMMCGVDGKYAWEAPLSFHHLRLNVECGCWEACACLADVLSDLTLPGLKSLQIEAACWSQLGHFPKFLDRSRNLTCLSLFGMSGLGNKELESLLGSIPALTRLTVRLKSVISAQMLQRLSNGLLLPRLQFLDMSLEHTVEARDALISLVRVRSPPQGCLEEIVVRVTPLSESRKQQLHDKLECFPRTRHRILKPELMYLSFSEWMEEVHKV